MTAYVITGNCNIDQLGTLSPSGSGTARSGGDTVTTNGFNFTVDQDSRGGLTGGDTLSFGNLTISQTNGGDIIFDGTGVWLIPYTGGAGNFVPAWNTLITQSGQSGSGKLIGVYSALTAASTATGAAMPASGFIKIKQVTGTYAAGALTGIGATASDAGRYGWIDIVGDDLATVSGARLGKFIISGAWYEIGTTDGNRATTYNVPNGGKQMWVPAIWVQGVTWNITGASWAAGVATYTATGHDMLVGQQVTVAGMTSSGYNVTDASITDITDDTFSVAIVSDPGAYSVGGTAVSYECWPCAGTLTATATNVQDEATRRGKIFWNLKSDNLLDATGASAHGFLRFGHDGTNSSGGYCPPSGRKMRIGNVFLSNCTTAARTQNVAPNATLANRYDMTMTAAAVVEIDKVSCNWYASIAQPYSCTILNSGFMSQLGVRECGTQVVMRNVCIGQEAVAIGVIGFDGNYNTEGILQENVVTTMAATTANISHIVVNHVISNGVIMTDCVGWMYGARTGSIKIGGYLQDCPDAVVTRFHSIATRVTVTRCPGLILKDTKYSDSTGVRSAAFGGGAITLNGPNNDGTIISGLKFVGARAQCYENVINGATLSGGVSIRNIGTIASPLDTGDGPYYDLAWDRTAVATNCVVTHNNHGLIVGDIIPVFHSTSLSAVPIGNKTLTASTTNTFTFVCTNGGDTTGFLSYFFCPVNRFVDLVTASDAVKLQRSYPKFLRAQIINGANDNSRVTLEGAFATFAPPDFTGQSGLTLVNSVAKMGGSPQGQDASAVYGTNWLDGRFALFPDVDTETVSLNWSRSGADITIGLGTGNHFNLTAATANAIQVLTSSSEAALNVGYNTQMSYNTGAPDSTKLKVNGTAAGAASGTCTIRMETGRITILANEGSPAQQGYTIPVGSGAKFTGGGDVALPAVGDSIIYESPYWIRGHAGFIDAPPLLSFGGTHLNYHIEYDIDVGSGFSGTYKTMLRRTAATCSTSGSATLNVPASASWIQDGDRIWTTGFQTNRSAKVFSGGGSTALTLDKANNNVAGSLTAEVFNLPQENPNIDWDVGFRLRVRVTTLVANTEAVGAITIRTFMTPASMAVTFPLDELPLTVTVKDGNTLAAIEDAHVYLYKVSDKSMVLSGATNASGIVTALADIAAGTDIAGWVRQQDLSGVDYEPRNIIGTISASGFETTILLTPN